MFRWIVTARTFEQQDNHIQHSQIWISMSSYKSGQSTVFLKQFMDKNYAGKNTATLPPSLKLLLNLVVLLFGDTF